MTVNRPSYSADVRMSLEVDGVAHRVAQVGDNAIYMPEPIVIAGREGLLTVSVDGRPHRWRVLIPPSGEPREKLVCEWFRLEEQEADRG